MGFKTAAMALREDSFDIDDPHLMAEEKLAVVLGTEGMALLRRPLRTVIIQYVFQWHTVWIH